MMNRVKLQDIRSGLEFMEDSIMLALVKRSRYPLNEGIYQPEGSSFFELYLAKREQLDNEMGRYDDRREHSFFPTDGHVVPVLRGHKRDLDPVKTNRNSDILKMYMQELRTFCQEGDDSAEYGTCAEADIDVLHEISRRVHLGEFVAEAKWQSDAKRLLPLLSAGETTRLTEALRDRGVERTVADRIREKAGTYGLNPDSLVRFYVDRIIPLTIEVEVEYLARNKGRNGADSAEPGYLFEERAKQRAQKFSAAYPQADMKLVDDVAVESVRADDAVVAGRITFDEYKEYCNALDVVLSRGQARGMILKVSGWTKS
jgi:monofunctional chorismate mutase